MKLIVLGYQDILTGSEVVCMSKLLKALTVAKETFRVGCYGILGTLAGGTVSLFYLAARELSCMGMTHPKVGVDIEADKLDLKSIIYKVLHHTGHISIPAIITLKFKDMDECDRTVAIGAGVGFGVGATGLLLHYVHKCAKRRAREQEEHLLPVYDPDVDYDEQSLPGIEPRSNSPSNFFGAPRIY